MTNLFLSGPFDYKDKGWGYAHYSYGFALDSFKEVVQESDTISGTFEHPFKVGLCKKQMRSFDNPVNISFLPPDVSLLVPGYKNICVFAWEFDKLPAKSKEQNGIFKKNYYQALREYNAVLTLSSYSQQTLSDYGINSFVLPSPVSKKEIVMDESIDDLSCYPVSTVPKFYKEYQAMPLTQVLSGAPYEQRFLYILNPHDIRKNFGNLVTAFQKFIVDNPNAVLILKMTAQGDLTRLQQTAFGREFPSFPDTTFNNVYFLPEKLSESKLQMLIESCQNYVSPSRAEGQNLPLCEAMASDRVCITPDHTSMSDYVTNDSAIILESNPWMIDHTTHKYEDFWGFSWFNVGEQTILDALNRAVALTPEEKSAMIDKAKQNVETFCSPESVLKKWQDIKLQIGI
jgi:glycosyltransferase involved in cell wall biosynthesis